MQAKRHEPQKVHFKVTFVFPNKNRVGKHNKKKEIRKMSGFNKKIQPTYSWIDIKQKNEAYGGVEDGSTTFWVVGFGWETLPPRTLFTNKQILQLVDKNVIVNYNKCQLLVPGETAKYVTWHFTGSEDPMVSMGYATEQGKPVKYTEDQVTRIAKIYGKTSAWAKAHGFVEPRVHVPMWRIERNDEDVFDPATMQPSIVSMTDAQLSNIVKTFGSLEDLQDKRPYGYVLKLVKDSKQKMEAYQWSLLTRSNFCVKDGVADPELLSKIQGAIAWNYEKLDKIFTEVNGGELDSETVWSYLEDATGMSRAEIDRKYHIRKLDDLKTVQTVSLGATTEAKPKGKKLNTVDLFNKDDE